MAALPRRHRWAIALTAVLAMAISYVDRQTLSVLAPTVTRELHISDAAYGWLGSAFSLAYLIGGPFAGLLVDRVGARRGLVGAMAAWSLVAAMHAVAPGFAALFALRLALGVTESPSFPGGVQTVQRALEPRDKPRGMSLLFVGMSLGGMIAPVVAISLATRFGWRAAFVGTAGIAALWVPLWLVVCRSANARAVLDDRSAGGVARPSLRVALHPAMLRGIVGLFAVVPASAFMMAWEAKYYVKALALKQADLAPYLVASAVAYDLGAIAFGDLAARTTRAGRAGQAHAPPRALVGVGALVAAAGMAILVVAPSPRVALVGFIAGAIGRGAVVTLCNTDTIARMPAGAVSAAAGVIASVQSLGAIIVNPSVGAVVQRWGYSHALVVIAAWTLPCALAWIAWRPPTRG